MRFLFFITFMMAILFSEVVPHVIVLEENYSSDYEAPSDETNESESSEENIEDSLEEDKLLDNEVLVNQAFARQRQVYPTICSPLVPQSLIEVHSPPPDNA